MTNERLGKIAGTAAGLGTAKDDYIFIEYLKNEYLLPYFIFLSQ